MDDYFKTVIADFIDEYHGQFLIFCAGCGVDAEEVEDDFKENA